MGDERKFAAFISYSHATDKELGPLLQEGVEKFAKPWYRSRARRVFLDNSVLAAESDLTQAILDGLAQAENFLLLASPASAESTWVDEEVAWWMENRDPAKLFVLVTDGEVEWRNGVLAHGSALPKVLHDIPEPRCVDLREVRAAVRAALRQGLDHGEGVLVPAERRHLLPERRGPDHMAAPQRHPET
jgi:hypothetical protein